MAETGGPGRGRGRTLRRALVETLVVGLAIAFDLVAWHGDDQLRGGGELPVFVVPLATLILYPGLVLRRRYPLAVFLAAWTYSLAGIVAPRYVPIACLLVALHAVAAQHKLRISGTALAMCAIPFGIDAVNAAIFSRSGSFVGNVAASALIFFTVAAGAWFFGRRIYLSHRKEKIARDAHEAKLAQTIRAERLSLAQLLHESVAHGVKEMTQHATRTRDLIRSDDDRAHEALRLVEATGAQAINELQRLLGVLQTGDTTPREAATEQPGLVDLPSLVEFSGDSGLDVSLRIEGRRVTLDRSIDLAAYRVVQEALTNATKHGGRHVSVRIIYGGTNSDHLIVQVWNDHLEPSAHDDPDESSDYGLLGLGERVALLGGRLEVGPVPDGFRVRAELPLGREGEFGDSPADRPRA